MSEKIKLWFFRDLTDEQRLKLFGLFGLPVEEIGINHGRQSIALRHITQNLVEMVRDEAGPAPQTRAAVPMSETTPVSETDGAAISERVEGSAPVDKLWTDADD